MHFSSVFNTLIQRGNIYELISLGRGRTCFDITAMSLTILKIYWRSNNPLKLLFLLTMNWLKYETILIQILTIMVNDGCGC